MAALLWITLLSRIGDYQRSIAIPLKSFIEIVNGRKYALIETAENVMLFIPFGFFCRRAFGFNRLRILGYAFLTSVLIESAQWLFGLGVLEVDDLITNTLGAVIGAIVPRTVIRGKKCNLFIVGTLVILFSFMPLLYNTIMYQHMETLASNGDRSGKKNLLVLNGQSGFVGNTDVYVSYRDDGSIDISGSADHRSWKLLGQITLSTGTYSFSGLTGTKERTIAIELEYFDEDRQKYVRLAPDVGPVDEVVFVLEREAKIKAYVTVYADAKGSFAARPVIFREK